MIRKIYRRLRVGIITLLKTPSQKTSPNQSEASVHQPIEGQPIRFRQLTAVCRDLLLADLTMDTFEWTERTKDRLLALGFTYPHPDELRKAQEAVETALAKRDPPVMRPPPHRPTARHNQRPDRPPLSPAEAKQALELILQHAASSKTPSDESSHSLRYHGATGFQSLAAIATPPTPEQQPQTTSEEQIKQWRGSTTDRRQQYHRTPQGWVPVKCEPL